MGQQHVVLLPCACGLTRPLLAARAGQKSRLRIAHGLVQGGHSPCGLITKLFLPICSREYFYFWKPDRLRCGKCATFSGNTAQRGANRDAICGNVHRQRPSNLDGSCAHLCLPDTNVDDSGAGGLRKRTRALVAGLVACVAGRSACTERWCRLSTTPSHLLAGGGQESGSLFVAVLLCFKGRKVVPFELAHCRATDALRKALCCVRLTVIPFRGGGLAKELPEGWPNGFGQLAAGAGMRLQRTP